MSLPFILWARLGGVVIAAWARGWLGEWMDGRYATTTTLCYS